MSIVMTAAGEALTARLQSEGKPLIIDTFVFANVPGLDPSESLTPGITVPTGHVVYEYPIPEEYRAYVNPNQVVYSALLGSDIGDWSFNWQGLYCSEYETLIAAASFPTLEKRKYSSATGAAGNNLTRNFLIEFSGARELTGITISAEVWQLDFTRRLGGIDERERLSNFDLYGMGWFDGDGWKVTRNGGQYALMTGYGYIGGIRAELVESMPVVATFTPADVWLDVCLKPGGSDRVAYASPMVVEPETEVGTAADETGLMHYRVQLATINTTGDVIDLRPPAFGDSRKNGGVLTGLTAPKGELLSYGGTRSAVIPANTDWTVPRYEVGSKKLDVYLAGEQCSAGEDPAHAQYKEVGNKGSMSTVVQWHDDIPVEYDIAVRVR